MHPFSMQAVYLLRGLFLLSRHGVLRASVFFYANTKGNKAGFTVFSRSGVTGSFQTGFQPKESLRALESVVAAVGDLVFLAVLLEDDRGYAYLYGTGTVATHIIAWRPVDGDNTQKVTNT